MKSFCENQGEKRRSVINVVFIGACILIIFWRMEFRSNGQQIVGRDRSFNISLQILVGQ